MKENLEELIEKLDFKGLAEAFHKGDTQWHAEEWKSFVEKIKAQARQEERAKVVDKADKLKKKVRNIIGADEDNIAYNQALEDLVSDLQVKE